MPLATATDPLDDRAFPALAETARERQPWERYPAARRILTLALCAAPLALGAVESWAWPVLTLLALAALAAWCVACLRQGVVRLFWSPLYGLGVALLALGLLQYFAGLTESRFATRNALILLAGDLILLFVAGQVFATRSSEVYRKFGRVVALFAAGLGVFSILQFFTSHGAIYWRIRPPQGAVFGPYVNRNDYAGLMEMLIPIAAAFALTRPKTDSRRGFYLLGVALAVESLLLTGSRGGMVALLAEVAIFAAFALRVPALARRRYGVVIAATALLAAMAFSLWLSPRYLSARMASVAEFPAAPEVTLGQRLVAARDTLSIFRAHPFLGAGLGSFLVVFPRYRTFAGNSIWEHAHDDYAEALAETGLAGGLLLLAGIVVFFRAAFGNRQARLAASPGWIQLGGALGCCGLLVHSFVDFNLHIPANAAWFAVCLGLAIAPPIPSRRWADPLGHTQEE